MNNAIFLPKLKYVKIANYSLYNKDIEFTFIDGVNLILGGNGVGKTTFINIIKYALIGLYKKDLTVRNYQGEKRLSRETYKNCNTYFRSRTSNTSNDRNGYVTLLFDLNDVSFEVTRSLYDTMITKASVTTCAGTTLISGEVIRQDVYAKYENSSEEIKQKYLQYNYEKAVATAANMGDFNDFIFFVNQILMFGEDRLNVLWDEVAQGRLLSNYLNDVELERKRKDYNNEAKYQDSISRHKQEEIKAIKKVLNKIAPVSANNGDPKRPLELMEEIDRLEYTIKIRDQERKSVQKQAQNLYKKIADISISINDKESELNRAEASLMSEYWPGLNSKYFVFKQQYVGNHICPMCNAYISSELGQLLSENECFFCHSKIGESKNKTITLIKEELSNLLSTRYNYEQQIAGFEKELDLVDREVRVTRAELFNLKSEQRMLEGTTASELENETAYTAMIKQVQNLTNEKEQAQRNSEDLKNKCNEIIQKIEENLVDSTRSISDIFKDFAEAFLKLPCKLSLDTVNNNVNKDIKLFVPVIDNKPRYDAEELSESQRFFIDYSFRMSILAFFYNGPSFYICETPDSSLDLSYEENAATTLLKYVEKPNSLILTSNLNNSAFIKFLIKKATKINVLNLLRYGKISAVQTTHQALQNLSNEIEAMINE